MTYIYYEKHDKGGNWTQHKSQGFTDYWLAWKEATLLSVHNNNICNIRIIEE